jgi:hypothetical protein
MLFDGASIIPQLLQASLSMATAIGNQKQQQKQQTNVSITMQ